MRRLMVFACEDCGTPTERQRSTGQPLVCAPCGIARATTVAVELARAKAAGWPEGGKWNREQFAGPQRERWRRHYAKQAR